MNEMLENALVAWTAASTLAGNGLFLYLGIKYCNENYYTYKREPTSDEKIMILHKIPLLSRLNPKSQPNSKTQIAFEVTTSEKDMALFLTKPSHYLPHSERDNRSPPNITHVNISNQSQRYQLDTDPIILRYGRQHFDDLYLDNKIPSKEKISSKRKEIAPEIKQKTKATLEAHLCRHQYLL